MNWRTWLLFWGIVWVCKLAPGAKPKCRRTTSELNLRECLINKKIFVVPDKFNGLINRKNGWTDIQGCIMFLEKDQKGQQNLNEYWPQMLTNHSDQLLLSNWHRTKNVHLYVLQGEKCKNPEDCVNDTCKVGSCQVTPLQIGTMCGQVSYNEKYCKNMNPPVKNEYIINITAPNRGCFNCDDPVKTPSKELTSDDLKDYNVTVDIEEGEEVSPAQAVEVMKKMSDLATSINVSSAALTLGEGIAGVLVRETEPEDVQEVSFAFGSSDGGINIVKNRNSLASFQTSATVPKEAFQKSVQMNVSVPFAALFRFLNMSKDKNSNVLGNEVLAIEMGTTISNLTDDISINFRKVKYEGIPTCHSWNGEGSLNWTTDGCQTKTSGDNITCQCSHLTFFAILMSPPNETTSSSDLNNLTIITQVGCGLSMFFLGIILFMHFLLRRTKASIATMILIHLVSAMFMLNLTFLINNYVANMKNSVGCQIMAAVMHYFMLATFTWFAVQAFHLCLQLHMGGKIDINRYLLKISITSWVLPGVVGIILISAGKYGEQTIGTNDTNETVTMCWIIDSDVHYIVNIGYYVLVFIFTFTTFIIILSWLFCLKRTSTGTAQVNKSGKSIVTILGLCCMLGITWGFAFFAHGILRIPAYYIFTVLNSFQGFFLFIYYHNTSHSGEVNGAESGRKNLTSSTSSTTTLKTNLDGFNPYDNA